MKIGYILVVVTLVLSPSASSSPNQWNGIGVIERMSMYPTYAIIKQGAVGGVANCSNTGYFSFVWTDFPPEVQARIMSMLLHAYTTQETIEVIVHDTNCGPEGYKQFLGHIRYL